MPKVADYFNAVYGKVKDPFGNFPVGKMPFISSGDTDNGVVGFFDLKPMYKNVISVARTGSIVVVSIILCCNIVMDNFHNIGTLQLLECRCLFSESPEGFF